VAQALSLLSLGFVQHALLACLAIAAICGTVGAVVVARRLTLLSGGIAHSCLGGVGLGWLFGFNPLWGALAFALASVGTIGALTRRRALSEDVAVGMVWSGGMALGALFLQLRSGYVPDLPGYLFGDILGVTGQDLALISAVALLCLGVILALHKEIQLFCFDEEFAEAAGLPRGALWLGILVMVGLASVALIRAVGVMMALALLCIPPATVRPRSRSLGGVMARGGLLTLALLLTGLGASFAADLPAGATAVLLSVALFLTS